MLSHFKVVALLSVLSSTALANDVFSHFNDAAGNQIGSTQFDTHNQGCFSVPYAASISFTQDANQGIAYGPYCLTSFVNGGCTGKATSQQFMNIEINDGKNYELNDGLVSVGSYKWKPSAC